MRGWTPHQLGIDKLLRPLRPLISPLVDAPSRRRLAEAVNIEDLRVCAEKRAHKMVYDYLEGAADDGLALKRSRDAFSEIDLHYELLSGLEPPLDLRANLFDQQLDVPFFCNPTAGNRMFHHEGEIGVAKASAEFGSLYCLSHGGVRPDLNPRTATFQPVLWLTRERVSIHRRQSRRRPSQK